MKGSYAQHSVNTIEYQQGRNSAEWNMANPYGLPVHNPYPSDKKEWLDWQIGYEDFFNIPLLDDSVNTVIVEAWSRAFDPFTEYRF